MLGLKRRLANMVFTTSENYDVKVTHGGSESHTDTKTVNIAAIDGLIQAGLTENEAADITLFAAGHEGAHVKYSMADTIAGVMQEAQKKGANINMLNGMCQVAEDYRVDNEVMRYRPGYGDLRNSSTKGAVKLFSDAPSGDDVFDLLKAVSFSTYGTDLSTLPKWKTAVDYNAVAQLTDELTKISLSSKDSKQLLESVSDLYFNKYHVEPKSSDDTGDGESDTDENEKLGESSDGKGKAKNTILDDTEADSTSEKNSKTSSGDKPQQEQEDENEQEQETGQKEDTEKDDVEQEPLTEQEIEDMMEDFGGKGTLKKMLGSFAKRKVTEAENNADTKQMTLDSWDTIKADYVKYKLCGSGGGRLLIWSDAERNIAEKTCCIDHHAGCSLIYTKNKAPLHASYRVNGWVALLDLQVKKMTTILMEAMRADKDADGYVSDNGLVNTSVCWRNRAVHDTKIFNKPEYEETGGFVVDLVLDSSGSQDCRTDNIRKQAFIVARACSLVGIPCRVVAFNSNNSVTELQRLRDYDDPSTADLGCFDYYSDCENRDGLALLGAYHELKKRAEPNKIMLVLSDGCPAGDHGSDVNKAFGGMTTYCGDCMDKTWKKTALDDNAEIIRKIRKDGVAVMGIYVGYETYLADEKLMFGNDFAYIREMKDFVPVVSRYLKIHIDTLDK